MKASRFDMAASQQARMHDGLEFGNGGVFCWTTPSTTFG
jgi:hypothetical protein